jgi:hypothetical protein
LTTPVNPQDAPSPQYLFGNAELPEPTLPLPSQKTDIALSEYV